MNAQTSDLAERLHTLDTVATEATAGIRLDNPADTAIRRNPIFALLNPGVVVIAALVAAMIFGAAYLWSIASPARVTTVDTVDADDVEVNETDGGDQGLPILRPSILDRPEDDRVVGIADDDSPAVELSVDPEGENGICFDLVIDGEAFGGGCDALQEVTAMAPLNRGGMNNWESPSFNLIYGLMPPGASGAELASPAEDKILVVDGGIYLAYSTSTAIGDLVFDYPPDRQEVLDHCYDTEVAPDADFCRERRVPGYVPVYADATEPIPGQGAATQGTPPDPTRYGQVQELRPTIATTSTPGPLILGAVRRAEVGDTGVTVFWWHEQISIDPADGIRSCFEARSAEGLSSGSCLDGVGNIDPQSVTLGDGRTVHTTGEWAAFAVATVDGESYVQQAPAQKVALVVPDGPVELVRYDYAGRPIVDE